MPKKISAEVEIVPRAVRSELLRRKPPSLRPDAAMMQAAAQGQPEAIAIRDSWRFSQPVRVLEYDEFEELIERRRVTFNG